MRKMGKKFYAIDLFAGCGGLSEGFKQSGFDVVAQIEMDKWALETLKTRHIYHTLKEKRKGYLYNRYFTEKIQRDFIFEVIPDLNDSTTLQVIQATLSS